MSKYVNVDEQKMNGCDYCNGVKPLTDKVYGYGSKFDNSRGIHIEKFGKVPILSAYVRENYFRITSHNGESINRCGLSDETIKDLASKWAVEIRYCPMCGKKLKD